MTGFFWFLKRTVPVANSIYLGSFKKANYNRVPEGEPILFVSNHPSAVLDPLVCGEAIRPAIHFLGRADLFKSKLSANFLRMSHMWPIYRDVDGKDSLDKNKEVFAECYESLKNGSPILLYGEGFTDERFIRRVKQIKKGAARIAFGAEESYDFHMGLKIIPLGLNYTNPQHFHSDLLVRFGEPILLKDFEEKYRENPTKTMLEVTRVIEERILAETIHVQDVKEAPQFENVLMLFEDSMHYNHIDMVPDIEERWERSKKLADKLNSCDPEKKSAFYERLSTFWKKINPRNGELYVIRSLNGNKISTSGELFELLIGLPFALAGLILNLPGLYILKSVTRKFTKRSVFYPGIRVAMSIFLVPILLSLEYLLTLPFIHVPYLYPMMLLGGIILGVYTLRYRDVFRRLKRKKAAAHSLKSNNAEALKKTYQSLLEELESL